MTETLWLVTRYDIIHIVLILVAFFIIKKIGLILLTRLFSIKIKKYESTDQAIKQKETIKQLFLNIFKFVVNVVQVILMISVFIPIGTLMASLGAFAFVITFSIQNILGDIVRGFFIIFEEMFLVGDYVTISGFSGKVLEIGLRTTKLQLLETNEIVLISNHTINTIVKLNEPDVEENKEIKKDED